MDLNNNNTILLLQKTAGFIKIALDRFEKTASQIDELEARVNQFRQKEAAEKQAHEQKDVQLIKALNKAAEALYETDFLTDEFEKKQFLKLAKEDPIFLANMLEKVCKAADVSLIGMPARVAAKNKTAEYDPVAARAFGYDKNSNYTIIDE